MSQHQERRLEQIIRQQHRDFMREKEYGRRLEVHNFSLLDEVERLKLDIKVLSEYLRSQGVNPEHVLNQC